MQAAGASITGISRQDTVLPDPQLSVLEDRRLERRDRGVVKWNTERSAPDIGSIGVRSRSGHWLKNQSFYSTRPNDNIWNNPIHAGPKTWKEWHGPRLHTDAPLMEHMDRLSEQQTDWEAQRGFVNTVRVQTLDRLYHQKMENGQREMASQWAPHRRSKREIHDGLNHFAADLDSKPVKELKKVMTPKVLSSDREAIKLISKKVQQEETKKMEWKQMEQMRREDLRAGHDQRVAYNDMLAELSGQPSFRKSASERQLPNSCTRRLEELARPSPMRIQKDITKHPDFRGFHHVDNRHALEALFPGTGHELSCTLTDQASRGVQSAWVPMPQATEPEKIEPRRTIMSSTGSSTQSRELIRTCSMPASKARLETVATRHDDVSLMRHANEQFQRTSAPPAPDQRKMLLREPLYPDEVHMTSALAPVQEHTSPPKRGFRRGQSQEFLAPPQRSMVYPVIVPTVEAQMEQPKWRPKRCNTGDPVTDVMRQAALKSHTMSSVSQKTAAGVTVSATVIRARNLPTPDRPGQAEVYVTCHVPGKAKSVARTRAVKDADNPAWNQSLHVAGWLRGDPLLFTVYDHDHLGNDDKLATLQMPGKQFYPRGFEGELPLENAWPSRATRNSDDFRVHMAIKPKLEVKVVVHYPDDTESEDEAEMSAPAMEVTLQASPSTWTL